MHDVITDLFCTWQLLLWCPPPPKKTTTKQTTSHTHTHTLSLAQRRNAVIIKIQPMSRYTTSFCVVFFSACLQWNLFDRFFLCTWKLFKDDKTSQIFYESLDFCTKACLWNDLYHYLIFIGHWMVSSQGQSIVLQHHYMHLHTIQTTMYIADKPSFILAPNTDQGTWDYTFKLFKRFARTKISSLWNCFTGSIISLFQIETTCQTAWWQKNVPTTSDHILPGFVLDSPLL